MQTADWEPRHDYAFSRMGTQFFMGRDMDEAIEALLAIGPGAELIRLNGDYGESRRPEIAEALAEHYAAWQQPDGSIVGRGSVWNVSARKPAASQGD